MKKYPKNWPEIRNEILLRAGGDPDDPRVGARCEKCGVMNYELVYKDDTGAVCRLNEQYEDLTPNLSYAEAVAQKKYMSGDGEPKYSIVVLTIAHVHDPEPMNVKRSNLAAWCQRCHNGHDSALRRRNARKTKIRKIIEGGQLPLKIKGV